MFGEDKEFDSRTEYKELLKSREIVERNKQQVKWKNKNLNYIPSLTLMTLCGGNVG